MVLALALAGAGCGGDTSPQRGLSSFGEDQIGPFRLEIRSAQETYPAGTPLHIEAALIYVGPDAAAQVEGPNNLIGWGLEQVGGGRGKELSLNLMCDAWTMNRGERIVRRFPETASWRPPPGMWRVHAISHVGLERGRGAPDHDCSIDAQLRAEVIIRTY